MNPEPGKSRRKRVLLIYTLVMLLPGVILGYLAYRGILNDQALREKQARQQLESISQDFFEKLDSCLTSLVMTREPQISDSKNHELLRFTQDPGEEKIIEHHQLLYLPEGHVETPKFETDPINWERGWEFEFQTQNFSNALKFYEDVLIQSTNPHVRLKALYSIARIRIKQAETQEAIACYDQIYDTSDSLLYNSLPAKALALKELIRLQSLSGDARSTIRLRNELIQCLLHPTSSYYQGAFNFLIKDLEPTDSCYAELIRKQKITDQTIQVFDESELLFSSSVSNPQMRYYLQNEETLCFISYTYPDGSKTGLILDFIPFFKSLDEVLFKEFDMQDDILWRIEGNSIWMADEEVQQEWISFPFPDQLPKWVLKMSVIKPSWISTILEPGNGVFLLIFIFIIGIMLFGLGFTIHILNQEFKLNKMKTEFISNVSHELKSPLTSIRQMTEMLHDQRIETELQRNDYYGIMLDQSEHLSHLIDNILDFSRMEENRKTYRFEEFDLVPMIQKIRESFSQHLSERGIKIDLDTEINEAIISADKQAIKQVFYNLIENAVKFSPNAKRIAIQVQVAESPKALSISVKDWGMGISKKDLDKIFDRFYRSAESQKQAIKGSGIGLTLVKHIVEAHKGSIEVESQPGEGSTFTVFLPLIEPTANEENTTH